MPVSAASAAHHAPFTEKYAVERVLGRGGMGTVFEARHARLGQRVAIKVLGEELRLHPELVRRFEREARAAGALTSPHAVRVFDIDQTDDGTPFIVMELLHGRDLADVVLHDGPQPVGLAVKWIIEACDAIAEAHRLGIIHRDIKPSNLLLCDSGSIKVLDFGIAKRVPGKERRGPDEAAITLGVAPLGTPQYMSPEQVRCAKDVDHRSDIWSLGVTLYELLCGRPPYDHDQPQACIAAIVADPVPSPKELRDDLPEELVEILLKTLSKDPDERFASVDELVLALAPFAAVTSESGQHRAVTMARRLTAQADTTLDGDGAPPKAAALAASERSQKNEASEKEGPRTPQPDNVVVPLRPAMREREETVPPAVTRLSLPGRGRRVRSTLALAAAGILGLAALVATPRCVGSRIDAAQLATMQSPPAASAAEPIEAPPAPDPTPEPLPTEAEPTPPPQPEPPPRPTTTTTTKKGRATAPPSGSTIRFIGDGRPAHGGITGPGF